MKCKACGLDTSERAFKMSEDICNEQCAWQYRAWLISQWNELMRKVKAYKDNQKVTMRVGR